MFLMVTTADEVAIDIWWVEDKDTTKHPTISRTAPHNKGSSCPNALRFRNLVLSQNNI